MPHQIQGRGKEGDRDEVNKLFTRDFLRLPFPSLPSSPLVCRHVLFLPFGCFLHTDLHVKGRVRGVRGGDEEEGEIDFFSFFDLLSLSSFAA